MVLRGTYDATTGKFFVNNDGSAVNARGEVNGINAAAFTAAIRAAAGPAGPGLQWQFPGAALAGVSASPGVAIPAAAATTAYPLGGCDPTGIALGPNSEIGVMCRQGVIGETLTFQILNKTTGVNLATLNAGGGDQITFDGAANRWLLATNRWTGTGKSCGGGSAGCPLTPVITVVDGTSRGISQVPSGNNSHSIAVGGGKIFSPFTAPSANGGGAALGFSAVATNGGIAIFQ